MFGLWKQVNGSIHLVLIRCSSGEDTRRGAARPSFILMHNIPKSQTLEHPSKQSCLLRLSLRSCEISVCRRKLVFNEDKNPS